MGAYCTTTCSVQKKNCLKCQVKMFKKGVVFIKLDLICIPGGG